MIPLPLHRRLSSRKARSDASYPVSLNLHSWVILPTHGPLQQAIFFLLTPSMGEAAHGRTRRIVALPPPRYRAEPRTYITALQSNTVPGNEQRARVQRARVLLFYLFRTPARICNIIKIIFGRTVQAIRNRPIRTSFYI